MEMFVHTISHSLQGYINIFCPKKLVLTIVAVLLVQMTWCFQNDFS